nr:uncharacterized protein LOC100177954 isoform X1 [Ciona intestinalis]|eukprot:XP_002120557.2 uncharacterized protein LOC100177954 isoform X1 [Ciona intestinalis]
MWSNYVKEEDRNSRMIDRRLGNGFNDDIKEIEPTESEESSSETGELSDEVNVDVSDDVDTSSTAEDDDDGIIIKYKYFLSSRKDQHGNPIKWWKTKTTGSEGNQNHESVNVRSRKQDTNLKNTNNESKEKTAQSGDREAANKDLVVLKYEYVKGDDVGRTRNVIKQLPTSPSYEVKSTQTTIFSKKSIRTDEDLRQFITRDNNAVQRNTDVAHKNTTDSYNAAKNKTNVSQNKTTDNCGAKFQNRTNVSLQHTNVSEQKTSVFSQRKSSVERSPSVGSPTRRSFSPPLSPRNKSPSYYHKEDVRTYVSNYVTPMKAKRPQVSTKKRKVKNNLTCVFAETPVQTRRISKCKEVNDEKRETKKNSDVSAKSDSKEKSPERIIFKANLGSLPYQGVFRLDDDIRYLKTFIHVISGIPPSRQSYFGDENDKKVAKRRKVRKLRELGFNGGDIIHLAVK